MKLNKIILDANIQTREEVFTFLGKEMEAMGIIDNANDYVEALSAREAQSTTGLANGFAIPHGKSSAVKTSAVMYIRNQTGIEWQSLDGSLITDIFALAIPEDGNHLDDLIAISTKLMDEDVCAQLRQANSEAEVSAIFE